MITKLSTSVWTEYRSLSDAAAVLNITEDESLRFLLPLSNDYPRFEQWFRGKVVPGIRTGTRALVRLEQRGSLIGIGIAKRDDAERKICTVRIADSHFGRGLGLRIFDSLLEWVDTDQPHLTVSERKLPAFERIFDYYGFRATSAKLGRYIPNVTEFSYNDAELVVL